MQLPPNPKRPAGQVCAASAIVALTLALPKTNAQWRVTVQNEGALPSGNLVGGTVDDIDEGEYLLGHGGPLEAGESYEILSFFNTNPAFPQGTETHDFALEASGFVDVVDGSAGVFNLLPDTDDGFRLRVNGVVIAEYVGITGQSETLIPGFTLHDGDFIQLTMFQRDGGFRLRFRHDADGVVDGTPDRTFLGAMDSGIRIYQARPTVYSTDFNALEKGTITDPPNPNHDGWLQFLALSPAFVEIQDSVALSGNALHLFTSEGTPPNLQIIAARLITPPNLYAHPLVKLSASFQAVSSDLSSLNTFAASLACIGGPHPGFEIIGFGVGGGNGTPKNITGVSVSLSQYLAVGDSNIPVPLTVGQGLAWGTWHTVNLIIDQASDQYVSITVDGVTEYLTGIPLPRSSDNGIWKRGQLIESISASLIPQEIDGDRTSDSIYWDNVSIEANAPESESVDFEDWQRANFTVDELADPGISGPDADPDNDGLCNQLENFFGTEPRNPSSIASIVPGYASENGEHFFTMSFPMAAGLADTNFEIQEISSVARD